VGGGKGSSGFSGKRGFDRERRLRAIKTAAEKLGGSGFATGRWIPGSLSNANQVLQKSEIFQPPEVHISAEADVIKARKASETVGKKRDPEEIIVDGVTYQLVEGEKDESRSEQGEKPKPGVRKIKKEVGEVKPSKEDKQKFVEEDWEIVLEDGSVWRKKPNLNSEDAALKAIRDGELKEEEEKAADDALEIVDELEPNDANVPNENLKIFQWEGMDKIVRYATGEIEWKEEKRKWFRDESAIEKLEQRLIWNDQDKLKWKTDSEGKLQFDQMSETLRQKLWLIWNDPDIDLPRKAYFAIRLMKNEIDLSSSQWSKDLEDSNLHPEEIYYNQALSPEIKEFWLSRILQSKFDEFGAILRRLNLPERNAISDRKLGPIVVDLMEEQGIPIPEGEEYTTTTKLAELGWGAMKDGSRKIEFTQDPLTKVIRVVYYEDENGISSYEKSKAEQETDKEELEGKKGDPIDKLKLNEKPTELAIKLSSETLISKTYLYQQPATGMKTTIIPLYDDEMGLIPVPRISQLTLNPLKFFHSEFLPSLVIFLGPIRFMGMGIKECTQHNIPTIGIVDNDRDPRCVTWEILGNGEGSRGIELVAGLLGKAGEEGKKRKIEK
jgi:hypothetical protein